MAYDSAEGFKSSVIIKFVECWRPEATKDLQDQKNNKGGFDFYQVYWRMTSQSSLSLGLINHCVFQSHRDIKPGC